MMGFVGALQSSTRREIPEIVVSARVERSARLETEPPRFLLVAGGELLGEGICWAIEYGDERVAEIEASAVNKRLGQEFCWGVDA